MDTHNNNDFDDIEGENIDDISSSSEEESDSGSDTESVIEGGEKKEGEEEQIGELEEGEEEDIIDNSDSDEESEKDEDEEGDDEEIVIKKKSVKFPKAKELEIPLQNESDEEIDEDDEDENYLQKFDSEINKNYINDFHPECLIHNYNEIEILSHVVKDSNNIIIDPLHKTIPFLTKYEKTRILGPRAKQIESGSKPFIHIPDNIIDGHIIAELELQQKKIPFIIRRPLPNGACEYWHVKDLEQISF